jgi:N6-L-threonylcarbamoyladenine synthase
MSLVLGIETSCDETAAAVFDSTEKKILSNYLYSQIELHRDFGGVMPEVASRSHVEKIDVVIQAALDAAGVVLEDIETIAVTQGPGLVGSLLVGICFAKVLAYKLNARLIGIDHNEGHIYSVMLGDDGKARTDIPFPHICLSVSGGHTSFFLVHSTSHYEKVGNTIDDAAGEAFDKVSKMLGLGYPGGPIIERMANQGGLKDYFKFPRPKDRSTCNFTFSGLKTAVLYKLVEKGAYHLKNGIIESEMTTELRREVSSSLLVCIGDVFKIKLKAVFSNYPNIKGFTLVGGVACNRYLRKEVAEFCERRNLFFAAPSPKFCTDNAAMISIVGAVKAENGDSDSLHLDVFRRHI